MTKPPILDDDRDVMESFRRGMSLVTASLHAVTTFKDGLPTGLLATAVCSLSTSPPSLICCINKNASAHDSIVEQRRFSVNVLSHFQEEVAGLFVNAKGRARFDSAHWDLAGALPCLRHAAAVFDCEVAAMHDGFTHTIFVATVSRCLTDKHAEHEPGVHCLLWHQQQFTRSAAASEQLPASVDAQPR